jgi:NDP-sugar pyrophosphorylase family protein
LSDVDLNAELAFHRAHGKIGTMAAVHPPSASA